MPTHAHAIVHGGSPLSSLDATYVIVTFVVLIAGIAACVRHARKFLRGGIGKIQ